METGAYRVRIAYAKQHAADFRLVLDVRRGELQHHRVSDALGEGNRLFGTAQHRLGGGLDTGARQQALGLGFAGRGGGQL